MSVTKRIDPEIDDGRSVLLSKKDIRDVSRLCRLLTGEEFQSRLMRAGGGAPSCPEFGLHDRQRLVEAVRRDLIRRQRRTEYFNRAMFGEPAWDMLLVLYIADFVGAQQTIGKLAEWIDIPLTTVVRWATYLEREHLIGRKPHPHDRRIMFVHLLDKGRDLLDRFLQSIICLTEKSCPPAG